jgi:porin
LDAFTVPEGKKPGTALLSKLQLSGTLRGEQIGLGGWLVHAQLFRFDGQSLSQRLGDIQTADNIEAPRTTRLFEAYIAKLWGNADHSVAVRGGLIDLNSQFDSIDLASLMINSSHGIGPDLSRSGRNGPSIYPVTAVGSTVTWTTARDWTFRLGLFDGVAGSPNRPKAFFAERLKWSDGLLVISQADWQPTKDGRLEAGIWGYTASQSGPLGRRARDRGAYLSYEGPITALPRLSFWLRGGFATAQAQAIGGYLGAGLVQKGTIGSRPDDRVAVAIAHAIVGDSAANALGIHRAETSLELTYQAKISRQFVVQPDVDYVLHPAGVRHAPDSIGLGVRLVFATAYPIRMTTSDAGDPTVPPDAAAVPDDGPGEP